VSELLTNLGVIPEVLIAGDDACGFLDPALDDAFDAFAGPALVLLRHDDYHLRKIGQSSNGHRVPAAHHSNQ
jgi:hypothetical protein